MCTHDKYELIINNFKNQDVVIGIRCKSCNCEFFNNPIEINRFNNLKKYNKKIERVLWMKEIVIATENSDILKNSNITM